MKEEIKKLEKLTGKKIVLKEFIGGGFAQGFKKEVKPQDTLKEFDDDDTEFVDELIDKFDASLKALTQRMVNELNNNYLTPVQKRAMKQVINNAVYEMKDAFKLK